jgi:hypothetical protein
MTLHEARIDLPTLGKRTYLHGTSIFNAMLVACDTHLGEGWLAGSKISSYKLIRESHRNGRFVVSDLPVEKLDASASLNAQSGTSRVFAYFVEEGRGATPEPYEESDYYQVVDIRPDLSGEFVLPANRPRGDFIRGVVGANKELHQKASHFTSPPKAIRFLYLKDVDGDCLPAVGPEYRVQINNLRVQDHEKEIWTINRVQVFADGFRSSFRICYSASKD